MSTTNDTQSLSAIYKSSYPEKKTKKYFDKLRNKILKNWKPGKTGK